MIYIYIYIYMSRYIISFRTGKKRINDGVKFLERVVEGQSFMIHQIRKMIGIQVTICTCIYAL